MIKKIFVNKTDNTGLQLWRYLTLGSIAILTDYLVLYILHELVHLHYLIAATPAFIIGQLTNYLISKQFIFPNSKHPVKFELTIFVLIGFICLNMNLVSMWYFTSILHLHYLLSKIISNAIIFLFSFFARKLILFPHKMKGVI